MRSQLLVIREDNFVQAGVFLFAVIEQFVFVNSWGIRKKIALHIITSDMEIVIIDTERVLPKIYNEKGVS
ncbi:hypothetical protein C0966_17105 (plasmid) [Bacillus methanolicus]|nr:hypothetical protein [Bacillus methanolicus]